MYGKKIIYKAAYKRYVLYKRNIEYRLHITLYVLYVI